MIIEYRCKCDESYILYITFEKFLRLNEFDEDLISKTTDQSDVKVEREYIESELGWQNVIDITNYKVFGCSCGLAVVIRNIIHSGCCEHILDLYSLESNTIGLWEVHFKT